MSTTMRSDIPRSERIVPWQTAPAVQDAPFPADEKSPGIYIHVPFCAYTCSFCGFDAIVSRGERHPRYAAAVLREMELARVRWGRRDFDSLHFGGGTPSLLEAGQLAALVDGARRTFALHPEAEIALEAEPGHCDREKLERLRGAGFTRVSFGVQSFEADELAALGRKHTPEQARRAIQDARSAGFPEISLDLMFGLPGQTEKSWRRTLSTALDLDLPHVSCYALSIDENSVLEHRHRQGTFALPPEEDRLGHMEIAMEVLGEAGYLQYEPSNFARPGHHSRHNLKYWCRTDYLGLGCGAHGFMDGVRFANRGEPDFYLRAIEGGASPRAGENTVSAEEAREETVFLELRKVTGFSLERFERIHGIRFGDAFAPGLAAILDLSVLERVQDRLRLTRKGMLLSDSVFEALIHGR